MPTKLTFEHIKEIINKEDILISSIYINNKTLLEIQCNICKKKYYQNFDRYKRGHRHQKCSNLNNLNNLNGMIGSRKRYGEIFLKETVRICEWCKENYKPKRFEQKFCNKICSMTHLCSEKEKLKINGRKGFDKKSTNNRSKNEILFSELCIKHFGKDDILCNKQIFKDLNGNYWDCDVYINSLKIAILWDGWYWHYGPNVSNKQKARDILKRKIIIDNGSEYYTIIDHGKFDKEFVDNQFNLFIHKQKFKYVLEKIIKA